MSKNVKYISSNHYGAPQLYGDRWGYGIDVLRKCLCEGFNIQQSVSSIIVYANNVIEITYNNEHHYQVDQTILITGLAGNLNGEYYITSVSGNKITANSYNDITDFIGQISQIGSFTSKVAPLGFIESFRDGDRSAFTTDEGSAYLYVDDRAPSTWPNNNGNRYSIEPLVYMTNSMYDIDTPGRFIVPYDSANPDSYRSEFMEGNYSRNGLWTWTTYGVHNASSGNTPANQLIPASYTIIGNGRLFYFIPNIKYNDTSCPAMLIFGKINSDQQLDTNTNYLLMARPQLTARSVFDVTRLSNANISMPNGATSILNVKQIDIGNVAAGLLCRNNKSTKVYFTPSPHQILNSSTGLNYSGGTSSTIVSYPDKNTGKYYLSSVYVNDGNGVAGKLSGLKWVYNASIHIHKDGLIYKYNKGQKKVSLYCCRGNTNINAIFLSGGITATCIFNISLDSDDWYNYE